MGFYLFSCLIFLSSQKDKGVKMSPLGWSLSYEACDFLSSKDSRDKVKAFVDSMT
jgi:hypothetical protein